MKIALVSLDSSYIHTNLAIRYIASAVKGHDVKLLEYTIRDRDGEILEGLYNADADIYGFSVYIWNVTAACRIASQLRAIRPDAKIVFGGPEVSYDAEEFLHENDYVDTVICGQGEAAFAFLADDFKYGVVVGGDHGGFDFRSAGILYDRYPAKDGQMYYYESSRGCPYRCSYCMSAISGTVRMKDADTAAAELTTLGRLTNGGTVKLIDRTFNCDEKRAEYIWEKLIRSGVKCRWHFEVRTELLTEKAVELLRQGSDIFLIEAGIQSTNEKTLSEIKRGGDPKRGLEMLKLLMSDDHPPIHADLIAGLPFEDLSSFERSFDDAYPLCDELQLGFLKLLRGSDLRHNAEAYEMKYSKTPPYELLSCSSLSFPDIRRLHGIADLVDRYKNGKGFEKTLDHLTRTISPFRLFDGLYRHIGDVRRLSQRKAYTELFAYAATIDGIDTERLRELISADFTAREKGSVPYEIRSSDGSK